MPNENSERLKALSMLIVANLFWGLSFPTIKALVLVHVSLEPESSGSFVTAMSVTPRYVLAAVVMLIWQARRLRETTRSELRQGVMNFGAPQVLYTYNVQEGRN